MPLAELADALFSGVGLGWHGPSQSTTPYSCVADGHGYFTDDSMLRRVHRERAIALSGPRALLMQAAHPLAVDRPAARTRPRMDEPYDRLARTAETMRHDRLRHPRGRRPRDRRTCARMHTRVRGGSRSRSGRFPAGTPYRADQPDLLLWVLFTLVDSGVVVYRKYVRRHVARRARPPTGTTTRSSASCSA